MGIQGGELKWPWKNNCPVRSCTANMMYIIKRKNERRVNKSLILIKEGENSIYNIYYTILCKKV